MKKLNYIYFTLTYMFIYTIGATEDNGQDDPEISYLEVVYSNYEAAFSNNTKYSYDSNETKILYDKYKVYSLIPRNETHIKALQDLQHNPKGLDFWTIAIAKGHAVKIMTSDEKYPVFEAFLKKYGFNWNIVIPNVQKLIDAQLPPSDSEPFSWYYFYDLDKIYAWLDSIISYYSTITAPLISGYSYEGRPIKGVKLSYKPNNPGVFIESGTHAREWIAPVTAMWILNELLTSQDNDIRFAAENYDWYIFPCVNPDGYQYSYKFDRFWRKTRSPVNGKCIGVDSNRNWDFHWSGGDDPCSSTYPGTKPFSEPETKSLAEYARSIADNIQIYLDFHSFSQFLMFPYSYTEVHAPNYDELMRIGKKSAEALELVYGTHYTVGDIASVVYPANGSSLDWMYGILNISLCYAFELRDRGQTGLLLPPNQIKTTGIETMVSVVTILKEGREIALRDYKEKKIASNQLNSVTNKCTL